MTSAGPDLGRLKKDELERLISRHEQMGALDKPMYVAAVAERERRRKGELDVDTTIAHLIECARRRLFTTYSDIALANGVEWSKAYRPMRNHLKNILEICAARGWPLLTAICVKKSEAATGQMEGDSLSGFTAGAEGVLRIKIANPRAFLDQTQQACFEWAAKSAHDRGHA